MDISLFLLIRTKCSHCSTNNKKCWFHPWNDTTDVHLLGLNVWNSIQYESRYTTLKRVEEKHYLFRLQWKTECRKYFVSMIFPFSIFKRKNKWTIRIFKQILKLLTQSLWCLLSSLPSKPSLKYWVLNILLFIWVTDRHSTLHMWATQTL